MQLIYVDFVKKIGSDAERGGQGGQLLNSINSFGQSNRTEHKLSWNGNFNGLKEFFPLEITPLQHFVNFKLAESQVLLIFCNFKECILWSSAIQRMSAPCAFPCLRHP